jgi:hypothetical protein
MKAGDPDTYLPRATTSTKTRITTSFQASTVDHTNDSKDGRKDDEFEDDSMCCDHGQTDANQEIRSEFVESISASSAALSHVCANQFHSYGYCADEACENENEIYNDLNGYDMIRSAIIEENDRLNSEVDEFLDFSDCSLRDEDFTEFLISASQ